MLVWLLEHLTPLAQRLGSHTAGDSRTFLTARAAAALVTAFLVVLLGGPAVIRRLQRHCGERVDSASARLNELHAAKNNTPTMGGLLVIAAIEVALLIWGDLKNPFVQIGIFVAASFAALGAADDWIKLRTARRGLSARQKLLGQTLLAAIVGIWLLAVWPSRPPGADLTDWLRPAALVALGWVALVMVGSSNGVNLTDGLDGLAGGCVVFAGTAFAALTYLAGHRVFADYLGITHVAGAGELCVLMAAMVGAMLGFLWFNCYPAQVFLGDAGSLPLGALLGLAALATTQELLLVLVGGVFVIETLSVIAQVSWFRISGKRLIACSPLHNHFLFHGLHEHKIVVRFWIAGALLALVAVASLKVQ